VHLIPCAIAATIILFFVLGHYGNYGDSALNSLRDRRNHHPVLRAWNYGITVTVHLIRLDEGVRGELSALSP
jgi:hypothetical protein